MKPVSFHPSPDRRLEHPYHVVLLPRKAPLLQRCWRTVTNLFDEWWAVIPQHVADRLYRVGMTLLVVLAVATVLWFVQAVDLMGNQTYVIHRSMRTGEVMKVLDPKGREVKMSLEEVAKLKHVESIPVP